MQHKWGDKKCIEIFGSFEPEILRKTMWEVFSMDGKIILKLISDK
jgi:hypothetical protein